MLSRNRQKAFLIMAHSLTGIAKRRAFSMGISGLNLATAMARKTLDELLRKQAQISAYIYSAPETIIKVRVGRHTISTVNTFTADAHAALNICRDQARNFYTDVRTVSYSSLTREDIHAIALAFTIAGLSPTVLSECSICGGVCFDHLCYKCT